MKYKSKLSKTEFKLMQALMKLIDTVHPQIPALTKSFGIQSGMVIVDYGCGPGRFTVEFSKLTGSEGRVYAVDLLEIALRETQKRLNENALNNVELKLAQAYNSGIPQETADMICAVDMFHHVDSEPFLKELYRIAKPDGLLIISGGHQTRASVKREVAASGLWELVDENRQFLEYRKKS